jgi:hypothetical protein
MDFTGAFADASFKDAWRFVPLKYSTGESAFIVRDMCINGILQKMKEKGIVYFENVAREKMVQSQWTTIKEKYYNALRFAKFPKGKLYLQLGYYFCRRLKKISIFISNTTRIPLKIQIFLSAIIGQPLSAFARFTNEKGGL